MPKRAKIQELPADTVAQLHLQLHWVQITTVSKKTSLCSFLFVSYIF